MQLAINNVSMRFGAQILFEDVNATFVSGRRYAITGPNGAGKSTMMKIMTGEIDPEKGTVAPPKKMGVLRQDQFAFDELRVIYIMGNARLWEALQSVKPFTPRIARPTHIETGPQRVFGVNNKGSHDGPLSLFPVGNGFQESSRPPLCRSRRRRLERSAGQFACSPRCDCAVSFQRRRRSALGSVLLRPCCLTVSFETALQSTA